jgi:hypothetical protein
MLCRCQAFRHQFARVLVVQILQRERALLGDTYAGLEQGAWINLGQVLDATQMAFAVRMQRMSGVGDRGVQADCGQRVLQCASRAHVHVHVAAGHRHQVMGVGEREQGRQPFRVLRAAMQFDGEMDALGEDGTGPADSVVIGCRQMRQPQRGQPVATPGDILARQSIRAFFGCAPTLGDDAAEIRVAAMVDAEQHQARAVDQREFGADDQL